MTITAMTSADEITRLMQQSLVDTTTEPVFFQALLDATVYAHVPRNDHSGRVRFIQFTTPEGMTVLPFFSDNASAKAAQGATVKVVELTGRQLFELTRGATLMLNPNGTSCTLYPEEIAALLDRNQVAIVERFEMDKQSLWVGPVRDRHEWLTDRLIALYNGMGAVEAAFLAELAPAGSPGERGWLIAIAVMARDAERVARATTTELQLSCQAPDRPLDLTAFEPGKMPVWLEGAGLKPFYQRVHVERFVQASARVQ